MRSTPLASSPLKLKFLQTCMFWGLKRYVTLEVSNPKAQELETFLSLPKHASFKTYTLVPKHASLSSIQVSKDSQHGLGF